MVTAGANQAFVNVMLTLTDESDSVVLFKPLYFNHRMALQMTGGGRSIVYGPPGAGLTPDLDWLERTLQSDTPPRMVVIVNPGNPSGATRLATVQAHRHRCVCRSILALHKPDLLKFSRTCMHCRSSTPSCETKIHLSHGTRSGAQHALLLHTQPHVASSTLFPPV